MLRSLQMALAHHKGLHRSIVLFEHSPEFARCMASAGRDGLMSVDDILKDDPATVEVPSVTGAPQKRLRGVAWMVTRNGWQVRFWKAAGLLRLLL
jgi:hypothetical protein